MSVHALQVGDIVLDEHYGTVARVCVANPAYVIVEHSAVHRSVWDIGIAGPCPFTLAHGPFQETYWNVQEGKLYAGQPSVWVKT